jgi:hypothetical protein
VIPTAQASSFTLHYYYYYYYLGQLAEALRYKPEGRGLDSRWSYSNFSSTSFFRPHYDLGVDSASDRNEYQKYFFV